MRDIILRLAEKETFSVHWSEHILEELRRNLKQKRNLADDKIENLITEMNLAFPDACIDTQNIDPITLSATKDKHVVATALQSHAEVIVTQNISDFPANELAPYHIEAQTPDEFLVHHFTLEETKTVRAVTEVLADLTNPSYTPEEYMTILEKIGIVAFTQLLRTSGFLNNN